MANFINKLEVKLTASFVILILAISGMAFLSTYKESKDALKTMIQDELLAVARVTSTGIDGDAFITIKPGDENKKVFTSLRDRLYAIQQTNPDIKYVYAYVGNDDKSIKFIVDAEYGISKDAAAIGEVYTDITPQMLEGLNKASVENEFSTDKWGTFLSGYAPIFNSKGGIVGAVGIDMASQKVIQKQNFIGFTIIIVIIIAVIMAGLIIAVFSNTIIRDIKKLNKVANDISSGNMNVVMDVKRKDEIGELADSFGRMVASLKIMMMEDEDKKK
jgi:methyl-accepting chemotaxis protein